MVRIISLDVVIPDLQLSRKCDTLAKKCEEFKIRKELYKGVSEQNVLYKILHHYNLRLHIIKINYVYRMAVENKLPVEKITGLANRVEFYLTQYVYQYFGGNPTGVTIITDLKTVREERSLFGLPLYSVEDYEFFHLRITRKMRPSSNTFV